MLPAATGTATAGSTVRVASATRPFKYSPAIPGRPSEEHERDGGGRWWLIPLAGLLTLLLIGLTVLLTFGGGSDEGSTTTPEAPGVALTPPPPPTETAVPTPTPTPTPPPPTSTPLPAIAPTPAGPILSGAYVTTVVVESDPAGHAPFIGMPAQISLNVLITRDTATGVITIVITGPPPWVTLNGTAQFGPSFTTTGGGFSAAGQGSVAGFTGVSVEFSGSVTADGGLQGTLRMGVNGRLPTGRAISYTLSGRKQ